MLTSEEKAKLEEIASLLERAEELGMQFERDNSGQLVIYTGVTELRRGRSGRYYRLEDDDEDQHCGIGFLTEEAVEKSDYGLLK